MARQGQYRLFSFRGIPIGVDWTWFLVLFLIIWLLSGYYRDLLGSSQESFGPYALAVATSLMFFGSILLHELGHAVAALRDGIGIRYITLWMFGGIAGLERDSMSAGSEFRIAAAGPLVTLLITLACLGLGTAIEGGAFWDAATLEDGATTSGVVAMLAWLGNINALVLVFNLLPAFPLDGGRIARAIAWKVTGDQRKATTFAARTGQLFAAAFVVGGVALLLLTDLFITGLWLAVIGWMLGQSAGAAEARNQIQSRIGELRVRDVMDPDPVAIESSTTIEDALERYFLRYQWPWFPVTAEDSRFLGLLKRGAADGVPEGSRSHRLVAELVDDRGAREQQVSEDALLESLLGNAELRRLGALAAVDGRGNLRGVITLDQVGRALRDALEDEPASERATG